MVFKCCVMGCSYTHHDYPMHRFPTDDGNYRRWMEVVGRPDLLQKPMEIVRKSYRVCDVHFGPESRYIGRWNRSTITRNAVPALFLPNAAEQEDMDIQEIPIFSETTYDNSTVVTSDAPAREPIATVPERTASPVATTSYDHTYARESTVEGGSQNHNIVRQDDVILQTESELTDTIAEIPSAYSLTKTYDDHTYAVQSTDREIYHDHSYAIDAVRNSRNRRRVRKHKVTAYSRHLRRIASNLQGSDRNLTRQIKEMEKLVHSGNFLKSQVNKPTFHFIMSQLKGQRRHPQGRRFSMDEKVLFLSLMKQSPKGYKLMRRIFAVPSRGTLNQLLRRVPFQTGINSKIMSSLREKVASMDQMQRYCSVVFDEMAIDPALQYNQALDSIDGFQDNGHVEDRSTAIADKVMVFMARGICGNWKQPLAYYFNEGGMKTDVLARTIRDVVVACQKAGLTVKALICDQGTSNVAAINRLYAETDQYFAEQGEPNNLFGVVIGGEEVVPLYDPPHLLKGIRNNFFLHNVRFQWLNESVQVAQWDHIRQLYELDGNKGDDWKLCNKLTAEHVENTRKMKVSIAAQVLSRNVAAAMTALSNVPDGLPKEAADTAQFVLFIDKLFDSVNGASLAVKRGKRLRCAVTKTSEHHKFWAEAIDVLKSISFFSEKKNNIVPPTVRNWIRTLEGFRYLWTSLSAEGVSFMCPRNFNQDCLENFFGCIRSHGARNINPNAAAFISSFKSLIINNYLSTRSRSFNCEHDNLKSLDNLKGFLTAPLRVPPTTMMFPEVALRKYTATEVQTLLRDGTLTYIAGYIAKKVLSAIKWCQQCKSDLVRKDRSEKKKGDFVIDARQYNINALLYPSTNFNCFFQEATFHIQYILPQLCCKINISRMIQAIVRSTMESRYNFQCTEHDLTGLLLKFLCKFQLLVWVKNINKILKGKQKLGSSPDHVKQHAAAKYDKMKKSIRKK